MNRLTAIGILRGSALTALFLLVAPFANAQVPIVDGPFSPYPPQYNPYLPHPATGAPSLASQATSAGVNATASGTAQVRMPSGVRIPIPVSQTAAVSKAALGNAARVAVRALGPIGAAATAYEVYKAVQEAGVSTCPPPDFFCRAPSQAEQNSAGSAWYFDISQNGPFFPNSDAACNYGVPGSHAVQQGNPNAHLCYKENGSYTGKTVTRKAGICQPGYHYVSAAVGCLADNPQMQSMTDGELEQTLQQKMDADFNFNRRLYDALQRDIAEKGLTSNADPINANTPVSVNAPPVTTAERTVSTTQTPRPDGSIDTTTVKETTTVNPTTTGTTQGTVKTTYPSTTTQTTTTTNNVTNNTTTSSTVVNNAPVEPPASSTDDKSPRECGTPGRPKCQIDETGTPEGKTVYQTESTKVDTAFDDMQTKLTTVTSQDGKDTSWGWSPTSWFSAGQCEPFDFGEMPTLNMNLAFDVCPHLQKAQELLSFMWVLSTIGVILAMVWETVNSQGA